MSEIYYSVYHNKKDGELYAVLDSVKSAPNQKIFIAMPLYKILKDKKLVKTFAPEKLEDLRIDNTKNIDHLKLVGSVYMAKEGDEPDFYLDPDVPHPMYEHLEEKKDFFVHTDQGSITHIPYSAICYFTTVYESHFLKFVHLVLNNSSKVSLKVADKDEHSTMIGKLKKYQDWKVKNESRV